MTINNDTTIALLTGIMIGALATAGAYSLFSDGTAPSSASADEPLYWVAPMDPNYRRDKPGKSPMGMDLVPVYAEEPAGAGAGADVGVGSIRISPEVVNKLGVRTTIVKRETLHTELKTVGDVRYPQDQLTHIPPPFEGRIYN